MAFSNIDLTRELVQAVRDAASIVDIASEYTRLERKSGADWAGLCPFHKEKTPSFHVDADKGLYYCFGCGAGGDGIKMHMELTGDDFPAAIESLARRYGIPMQQRRRQRRADEPDVDSALAAAAEFFVDQLGRQPVPQRYLAQRQMPPQLVNDYGVGYAPDSWTALLDAVRSRVPERDLLAAGLVGRSKKTGNLYDRFRNRLMFPVHNPSGRLVGFGGRTLGDDKAKYVNTSETDRFHKSELLYGLYQARRQIRDGGRAVLVEGYFDVLGAAAAGVEGAVATMGTALTPEQAKLVARYADEVVVGYDGDKAGETAHRRALPILLAHGMAVYRARFPEGHDPDSLRLEAGDGEVVRAVSDAADSVIAEIERLAPPEVRREPRRQARAASALGGLLGRIPDEVLRFSYARRAAEALDIPVEILLRKVPAEGEDGSRGAAGPLGRSPGPRPGPPPDRFGTPPPEGRDGGGDGASRGPASPVRSLEELTLELLFGGADVPPAANLPPAEVFFDPHCRNIYRAYYALYRESGTGRPPEVRDVLAELGQQTGEEGAAMDRIARLLVGSEPVSRGSALPDSLEKLTRRWLQQRLRDLSHEITEAQRHGDGARLDRLLREKTELSHRLHRGGA